MATLDTQFAIIEGCRLEYQWHGPPADEAPTVVFLHEGLGAITRWRDFPATLCAQLGWGGLVYNRQGYGRSDPLRAPLKPPFMHHEALDVLPRVLDTFKISRPVLFGHSDGGSIALISAGSTGRLTASAKATAVRRSFERRRKAAPTKAAPTMAAPTMAAPTTAAATSAPRALILESPHVFVEDMTVASIAALRDSYRASDLRERLARHHGSNTDVLFESWTRVWLSDEFRGWNIEAYLPAVTCPTLVIQGRDDEYGTVRQLDAIVEGVAGEVQTLVLDACGHSPHIDQREAVEAAALRCLEGLDLKRRFTDGS
ncbi:MAG TPA: alpha/beta hydrolase [Vicinamibacterales bacterium]